ncbi:hypothetical protein RUM44_006299 [Polyplax serrata]|uniref:Uncharacterized protein n=1 Tax=Polyplax serrata TaxID=468196 RepID=A0ABR1AHR7_POLSC
MDTNGNTTDENRNSITRRKGRLKDKDGSKIFGNNNNNNHKNYLINLLKKTLEKEKGEFVKKIEADVTELSEQIVNTVESKALLGLEDSENVKEGSMNKSGMMPAREGLRQVQCIFDISFSSPTSVRRALADSSKDGQWEELQVYVGLQFGSNSMSFTFHEMLYFIETQPRCCLEAQLIRRISDTGGIRGGRFTFGRVREVGSERARG